MRLPETLHAMSAAVECRAGDLGASAPVEYFLDRRLGLARAMTADDRLLAVQRMIISMYMYNSIRGLGFVDPDVIAQRARAARAQFTQQLDEPAVRPR